MSVDDQTNDLDPVSPSGAEGAADEQPPDQSHRADVSATVTISDNQCSQCGAIVPSSYHKGCDAAVIQIDTDWVCSSCGVQLLPTTTCESCGSSAEIEPTAVATDRRTSSSPELIEIAIHEETNRKRSEHGLSELSYTDHLSAIALQHSRDMAQRGYFSHESPEGDAPIDRYRQYGHDTRQSGENLAKEYAHLSESAESVAKAVVDGWMNSPPHRENILREAFDREGIGVHLETDGAVFATQNFA